MTPTIKAAATAHQTFAKIKNRPHRIILPCGKLTAPIAPDIAQRMAQIAKVSKL